MAELDIVVGKFLDGNNLDSGGAVADILPLGKGADAAEREHLNVVIPVGDSAMPRTFSLPAGDYVVQARLPSGEFLSKRVEVSDNKNETLVLRGASSPNEWLSWQNYHGGAPLHEDRRAMVESAADEPDLGTMKGLQDLEALGPVAKTIAARHLELPRPDIVSIIIKEGVPDQKLFFYERLSDVLHLARKGNVDTSKVVDILSEDALPSDNAQAVADLLKAGRWESRPGFQQLSIDSDRNFLPTEIESSNPHERVYLIAQQNETMWLSMLPLPWQNVRSGNPCRADITFRTGDSGDISMNVLIRDATSASLLGYLRSGDTAAANTLLKEAENYLFQKFKNPFSATAGGLVLVADRRWRGTGEKHNPNWRNWIRNLAEWFPWLPDGRILHGWMYLLSDGEEDMEEARTHLLHSAELGLPVFTDSIRLLVDGLKLFSHEARGNETIDKEVDAALERLEPIAMRLDTKQTFTTIRLIRRPVA